MTIHIGILSDLPARARTVVMIGNRSSDHLRELIRIAEFSRGARPIGSKRRRNCSRAGSRVRRKSASLSVRKTWSRWCGTSWTG